MQQKQVQELEQRVKERIIAKDLAEKRAKQQAAELGEEIKQLTIHVQTARDATDNEKKRRQKVETEAKEFEKEAQSTVNELMRQLKQLKIDKERSNEKLQKEVRRSVCLGRTLNEFAICELLSTCFMYLCPNLSATTH